MEKNEIINLEIIDVGINGEGIAKLDNFVVFVPFALKGELVKAKILKVNKNFAYAKVEEILRPSDTRVTPKCPVFKKCGGCNLQHTTYANQLEIKQNIVYSTLKKMLKSEFAISPVVGSPKEYEYRNKMQFPINESGIGMYAINSHRLVPLEYCPLSSDWCKTLIEIIKTYIKKSNITLYNEETNKGVLRNVLARVSGDSILVTIVCNGEPKSIEILSSLLKERFENYGLYYNINRLKNNTILTNEFVHISGIKEQTSTDFGITHRLLPLSFAQINIDIQNLIYSKVLDLVQDQVVIDAYSGAGLLSAILSKKAKEVYGIEIVQQATQNADDLKVLNGLTNLTNINGDCAQELPKLISTLPPCTVVLDPPRKGCDKRVIDALNVSKPTRIVYISCNPASLARDLSLLEDLYNIELVQPFDMFPQTKHIETLVSLRLKGEENGTN